MADWPNTFLENLNALRTADPGRTVFGSEYHQYKLNPPLSEPLLAEAEDRYGCKFPADYRRYLLEIADGGAGPGLGIFSLAKAVELSDSLRDFPFQTEYSFYPSNDGPYCYDDLHNGSLVLSHYGCSMFAMLIVRGESGSQIWYDGEDYVKPLASNFSEWIVEWATSATTNLGASPAG